MNILHELKIRGLVQDITREKDLEIVLESPVSFYCGFDPTAESLHVGSLLPLLTMKRFMQAGHRGIVLIGTATGMIGDPSGKSAERELLDSKTLEKNSKAIESQVRKFFADFENLVFVKNGDWLQKINIIEFLRDFGKMVSVNAMIARDAVRERLQSREQGISYTEFSYALLQAYDFFYLNKTMECSLQIGGSDQWGNITAGLELIRKNTCKNSPRCFGLTFPLLTQSCGKKLGKTESEAIWLSKKLTSPYRFYQYWMQIQDADAPRLLNMLSFRTRDEIKKIVEEFSRAPHKRLAQEKLAEELTELIHGKSALEKVQYATEALFGGTLSELSECDLEEIFAEVPSSAVDQKELEKGICVVDLFASSSLSNSKSAARRLIKSGGAYINNEKITDEQTSITATKLLAEKILMLRSGRKSWHLIRVKA